jgi:hypothetical protein
MQLKMQDASERKIRFASNHSPAYLFEKIESIVRKMGFQVHKSNGKVSDLLMCLWTSGSVFRINVLRIVVSCPAAKSDPRLQGTGKFQRESIIISFCGGIYIT